MHVPPEDRESGSRTISFYSERCTNTDKSIEGLSERHLLVETLALYSQPLIPPWLQFVRVWPLSLSLPLPLPSTSNQQSNIRTYVRKRVGAGNLTFDIIYFDTRIDRPRYSLRYSPPVSPVQFSTLVFPSSVLARVKLAFPCLNSRRKAGRKTIERNR